MIDQLKIEYYQSHKDSVLNFHPGVNIIVGNPQDGKSAILRAFRWLTNNRPLGFRYHSRFAGEKEETKVSVKVDGHEIIKTKSKNKTRYFLDGEGFKGFGDDVPVDISNILNLTDLNFQTQLDQFFLINSPASDIAKTINKVTGTEKVDEEWIPKLTKEINKTKEHIEFTLKDISSKENKLKEYENLPLIVRDLKRAQRLYDSIVNIGITSRTIEKAIVDLRYLDSALLEKNKFISGFSLSLGRVEELIEKLQPMVSIEEIIEDLLRVDEGINQNKKYLKLEKGLDVIDDLTEKIGSLEIEINSLDEELDRYANICHSLGDYENIISVKTKEFKIALSEMKVCPVCYSEINNKQIDVIMGKL